MITLALSCPAKGASAAVLDGDEVLAEFTAGDTMTGSELLLPMAEAALRSAGKQIADVHLFAVTAGPGSFTGVRIGIALVKGLAFGRGNVCCAVSTLEALAENVSPLSALVCPVMDARRGEVYTAIFRTGGEKPERLMPDSALTATALSEILKEKFPGEHVVLVGDGIKVAKPVFESAGISVLEVPNSLTVHSAASCGKVALRMMKVGETVSDEVLAPVYLRESQAETDRRFGK